MTTRRRWSRGAKISLWVGVGVGMLVVASAAWVGARGIQAKDALTKAEPLAARIEANVTAGHQAAAVTEAAQLAHDAARAASLTGDPVWRIAEYVPFAGPNLRAVRVAAEVTDTVATGAVQPIARAATQLNISNFKPVGGAVDVAAIEQARPALTKAVAALKGAATEIRQAPSGGTISAVSSAVVTLRSTVDRAKDLIEPLSRVADLAPTMLGESGPRNYLLMFVNPDEIRASGGITGSLALLTADDGRISLTTQASDSDLGSFDSPVAPLPKAVLNLYGTRPAEFIQDVNLTPDFPLSASLAATMWTARYGTPVDGVISIDPVVLGYLLNATGPIPLADGQTISSSNAVQLLLSQAYQIFPDNQAQDAFFAATAAAVFDRLSSGDVDPSALITALGRGGSEGRIHVWSRDDAEQKILAGTTVAGALPVTTAGRAALGLYLNDSTGAKLDYYLHVEASSSSRICRAGDAPDSFVSVRLTNDAPVDAGTSLPAYVTNVADSGVPAGTVITQVGAYGPSGALLISTTSGGKAVTTQPEVYQGRPVSQFSVTLAPGQSKTVIVRFHGGHQRSTATTLQLTPGLHSRIVKAVAPSCSAA